MEVVAAIVCPGSVHTALNLQAALCLLIPLIRTNENQSLKVEGLSYPTEKGDPFSPKQFHAVVVDSHAL